MLKLSLGMVRILQQFFQMSSMAGQEKNEETV